MQPPHGAAHGHVVAFGRVSGHVPLDLLPPVLESHGAVLDSPRQTLCALLILIELVPDDVGLALEGLPFMALLTSAQESRSLHTTAIQFSRSVMASICLKSRM